MLVSGQFRVIDSWVGKGGKKGDTPRASVTLSDKGEVGQLKINFSDGIIPPAFAMDEIVKGSLRLKPAVTSFGLMLQFVSLETGKVAGS